jgi:threonine synthase
VRLGKGAVINYRNDADTKETRMSCITDLVCVACGATYKEGAGFTCPACGPDEGILDVRFDLAKAAATLTREALATRPRTLWRYGELLPVNDPRHPPVPQVGWTPVLEAPRLARALGVARLRLKDEGRSASNSFKDRASAIGVARAVEAGRTSIACASTGNAATSLAHCAAVAGIRAYIFVPKQVPEGKLAQLLAYGATVFRVQGTYAQAYALCSEACTSLGWYNRNCAVNPYLVEGKKTGGLELAEQCADDPPDWVVCSVGDGCSIAGIAKGLAEMKILGISSGMPRVLGVQAAGVAPIAKAFGGVAGEGRRDGTTYADSINVAVPRNRQKAINAVRDSGGAYVVVTDGEIMQAVGQCGRLAGVFAEPAAAAAAAGVAAARQQGVLDSRADVAVMITGNGLKDVPGALRALGGPNDVRPDMADVIRVVEQQRTADPAEPN